MIAIVTPVFNDWASLAVLLGELDEVASKMSELVSVVVVDDGSIQQPEVLFATVPRHLTSVELITLHCNLGHQRAIAIGLSHCASNDRYSSILVMDCDGEDAPRDIPRLCEARKEHPDAIMVAVRSKRSEGLGFRLFYQLYKFLFRSLTGKLINFGNFSLMPARAARRLSYMPDTWNHLAASIVKSNLPLISIPSGRGRRYAGRSSMSLVSLVVHGCSGISVFSDRVLTRLLFMVGAYDRRGHADDYRRRFRKGLERSGHPGLGFHHGGFFHPAVFPIHIPSHSDGFHHLKRALRHLLCARVAVGQFHLTHPLPSYRNLPWKPLNTPTLSEWNGTTGITPANGRS